MGRSAHFWRLFSEEKGNDLFQLVFGIRIVSIKDGEASVSIVPPSFSTSDRRDERPLLATDRAFRIREKSEWHEWVVKEYADVDRDE